MPSSGPLVLVGNHPNGLVDPVLVAGRTSREVRFLGKAPLFELPVLGWILRGLRALPVYRAQDGADTAQNAATFEAVFDALQAGDVVCVFPEGRSHSEPTIQRLKTGAARMALGAAARSAAPLDVRVVPVGLVYRRRGTYRSAAATWVGEAIECADLRALHAQDERAAVAALNERIAEGLRAVTVDLEGWEDMPLLREANRLWPANEAHDVERLQALARGLRQLRREDPERAQEVRDMLARWCERLERLGISSEDLGAPATGGGAVRFAARYGVALLVGLPLGLLGVALWAAPYLAVRWVVAARRTSPDVIATVKILAALVFFPLWLAALVTGAWLLASPLLALAVLLLAPPVGAWAADWWPRRAELWEDGQVSLRLSRAPALRERLEERRHRLRAVLLETAERLR